MVQLSKLKYLVDFKRAVRYKVSAPHRWLYKGEKLRISGAKIPLGNHGVPLMERNKKGLSAPRQRPQELMAELHSTVPAASRKVSGNSRSVQQGDLWGRGDEFLHF